MHTMEEDFRKDTIFFFNFIVTFICIEKYLYFRLDKVSISNTFFIYLYFYSLIRFLLISFDLTFEVS